MEQDYSSMLVTYQTWALQDERGEHAKTIAELDQANARIKQLESKMSYYSDGRCAFCDLNPPDYPVEFHSDWVHDNEGSRDYDKLFPFTQRERDVRTWVNNAFDNIKKAK